MFDLLASLGIATQDPTDKEADGSQTPSVVEKMTQAFNLAQSDTGELTKQITKTMAGLNDIKGLVASSAGQAIQNEKASLDEQVAQGQKLILIPLSAYWLSRVILHTNHLLRILRNMRRTNLIISGNIQLIT
jgi:hypothetical protein